MAGKIISSEIKKLAKAGNIIIGSDRAIKSLKSGNVQKILLCSNCPAGLEKDAGYYAGINGAEVIKLSYQNDELGVICKKPFPISILAVLKGAK
ncbi:ribosomal L7Ae/L30e/S12e/Gadd45 family protein [Candidatus Woesearchaeota archaeon]|nr:ribosomal L7Ae/L30e/S12e/Gadd45 family protein [Candidatus Woesearchaeota archaeon]